MRILIAHNHYQKVAGEDTIFAAESDLLEYYGNHLRRYTVLELKEMNPFALAGAR